VRKDFVIHWANESLKPQPEPDWVVEKLIAKPGVIMWFGDSGSKKSYTQFHQAVSVAMGAQWLGFPVRQQTVLIIDEENGDFRMRKRIGEILRGMGFDENHQDRIPLAWVCDAHWNFMDERDVDALAALIRKLKVGLVLVDSFVDVMRGGDENSSKDTHRILQGIRDVSRAANCVLSVVHHTNRKGGYRGSSNIKGEVDAMVEVESKDESPNVNFSMEKNRDGLPFKFAAVATWDTAVGEFFLTDSTEIGKLNPVDLYVMRRLTRQPLSIEELLQGAPKHLDVTKIRRAILKLTDAGRVERTNHNNPAQYKIKPKKIVPEGLEFLS
jgi:hypothetical protein